MNASSSEVKANDWLENAVVRLRDAGIGSARLDALIMLEDELQKDRSQLLAHPELVLSKSRQKRLNAKLRRRCNHVPLAYIRGFSEFYGRKFKVNKYVLEPRPESETMIELLKKLKIPSPQIADIGTGSGCLGITAALELHTQDVDLYDIDSSALAVAKHNTSLHELKLKAYKKDLLKDCAHPYDVLLANLPYVPDHYQINQAAAMEPRGAIFGGSDGLDIYRRLFRQIGSKDWRPRFVLTESLPPQHKTLVSIAQDYGYAQYKRSDFIQVFRFKP